jgi:hypothetical protein
LSFDQNGYEIFNILVTAVSLCSLIPVLTGQLTYSPCSGLEADLRAESIQRRWKNGKKVLDFPHKKTYYTNADQQP